MKRTILVTEDNEVNLELITLLITQYAQTNDLEIEILTATNGSQAVELCDEHAIDIIFMDLMMPSMNGSEATKIIKEKHPSTMIIVVSALGDEARQKEMLYNGAEDYMIKPVNAPLFKKRLHNYLQLIQTRNHIRSIPKPKNLFTSKLYHYHMEFHIGSDADLSEFWEAMLMRLELQRHIDKLSDLVRFIFNLGSLQLQQKFQFHIVIEEDHDNFFFTLDNISLIGSNTVDAIIQRHYPKAAYLCKDNLVSFLLPKTPIKMIKTKEQELPDKRIEQATEPRRPQELFTFDILDADEIEDVETHILKLRSLILLMQTSVLEDSDIEEICLSFDEISSILSFSNDTFVISESLRNLAQDITSNQEYFKENSDTLFEFVNAFMNDLIFWKSKIFYEGAPSVDFLNDSITTNANMLSALLHHEMSDVADVDNIFDF